MPALYRTYRPRRFSEVVGQPHIVQTLRNAVVAEAPAHAYLFCGSRGLGKTTLARVLARALNCQQGAGGEACLSCAVCAHLDAGTFLDLVEVDAASNTGVDNIRALIETVRYQPTMGRYKVYIIDEAHMLSRGAWNALLKTLEEPPERTIFVLATTEIGKVPATISSRAQRFDFLKFSTAELVAQVQFVLDAEKKQLPPEALNLIALAAAGGMRDALTLLDQVLSLGTNPTADEVARLLGVTDSSVFQELLRIIRAGTGEALPPFFDTLNTRYFDMVAVNRDLLLYIRELLETRLRGGGGDFSEPELLFLLRQFMRSYKELAATPDPTLPLLVAALEATVKFAPVQVVAKAAPTAPVATTAPTVASLDTHAAPKLEQKSEAPPTVPVTAPSAVHIVAEVPVSTVGAAALQESVVRERWPEVCDKLKDINGPLATLIKDSPIVSVEGDLIVLGVKYLFHKERLESAKNRLMIAEVAQAIFGTTVRVGATFVEREEADVPVAEVLGDALKIFGGELVE